MPRLRMLRLIRERLPHKVRVCPGYFVIYWTETLECGHSFTAYADNNTAKRRNCNTCVKAAAAYQSSPSLPRKKPAGSIKQQRAQEDAL